MELCFTIIARAFLNGCTIEEPHSIEFSQFLSIYNNIIIRYFTVYRTEISLFHVGYWYGSENIFGYYTIKTYKHFSLEAPGLKIAGQADCLCTDSNGDIVIWDWRRWG